MARAHTIVVHNKNHYILITTLLRPVCSPIVIVIVLSNSNIVIVIAIIRIILVSIFDYVKFI